MRVPLRAGDARRVVGVAGDPAQLRRHERGVRVVDAEDDRLLVTQPVLPEQVPEVLGDDPRAVRQANVALEVGCRVPLAVGSDVALFVEIRDPLVEQVGNEVPVLDRLL